MRRSQIKHVLLALVVAGAILRIGEASESTGPLADQVIVNRVEHALYVLPFSHIDAFAAGGYLALYGQPPSRARFMMHAVLLALVGLLTERHATGTNSLALGFRDFMADSWTYIWAYSCFNVLFGVALLMLRAGTLLTSFVEHPAVAYLGKMSYGCDVYHFGAIWAFSFGHVERIHDAPVGLRVAYAAVFDRNGVGERRQL